MLPLQDQELHILLTTFVNICINLNNIIGRM